MAWWCLIAVVLGFVGFWPLASVQAQEEGFVQLFNGKDLTGWAGDTKGYIAENGMIVCKPGGQLYTEKEYSDFVFRFEFKLTPGANNGIGIRWPGKGDAAYQGMEIQVLDDTAAKYAKLQPYQYHGSIYGIVPAIRGHQKPVGEWNVEEISAIGPHIKVTLNGVVIVDANLDEIKQTDKMHDLKKHPGLHNKSGRIGFLGHGDLLWFRNIRVKDLSGMGVPAHAAAQPLGKMPKPLDVATGTKGDTGNPGAAGPAGFTPLFNGKDLTGWKGLVGSPITRAKMTPEQLKAAQEKADESMRTHWRVEDNTLVFDGKGQSLCTAKDYTNFEMLVDWKILPKGDSGIYLRGSPQVQIWDNPLGSGGLYNNQKNPRNPLVVADKPIGQWNTFRIKMVGEKVTVYLNDKLVADNVTLENYWDRKQPIFPTGQIELQNHGNTLWFRNLYIRELP